MRDVDIVTKKMDGMTVRAIGLSLNPPVTFQRVQQILRRISIQEGIVFPYGRTRRLARITVPCCKHGCWKTVTLKERDFVQDKKYACCQKHRVYTTKYVNPDGTPMSVREKAKWSYHNNPERRAAQLKASLKYHRRMMRESPAYRLKLKEYSERYYARKRSAKISTYDDGATKILSKTP